MVEDCFRSILVDLLSLQETALLAPLPNAPVDKIEGYPHINADGDGDEISTSGKDLGEPANAAGTPVDDPNTARLIAIFPTPGIDGASTPRLPLAEIDMRDPTGGGGLNCPIQRPLYPLGHGDQQAADVCQNLDHQTRPSCSYSFSVDGCIDSLGAAPSTSTMDHCFNMQFSSLNNHGPSPTTGSQDDSMLFMPEVGEELDFNPTTFQISNADIFTNASPGNEFN